MIGRKTEYEADSKIINRKPALFPEGTLFGSATSAYQIEGAADRDGRGASIWDVFSHKRGRIRNNENGDKGSDHYKRYVEDVSIMGRLGMNAYRFSVSWPRVFPDGRGAVNEKGLDFYDRLVDELMKAGIRPFATLFHWDFPQQLFRETGGFLKRQTAVHFADYAETVVRRLGDRVKDWITLNEPWVHSTLGYLLGVHAPGRRKPVYWSRTVHNQLLAHAMAMERIKLFSRASRVGISLSISPVKPLSSSIADKLVLDIADQMINRVFLEPLFRGEYPPLLVKRFGPFWHDIRPDDMKLISSPVNFLGINTYSYANIFFAPWVPILRAWQKTNRIPLKEYMKGGIRHTAMGWEVQPESIYRALMMIKENYGNIPVYVTENGAAFTDRLEDYRVRDGKRIEFLSAYTAQAARAAEDGCDLRGFFVWSLLDNFEWAEGYGKRFGLVYVDYETGRRYIKDSGYWYRDLILANRR